MIASLTLSNIFQPVLATEALTVLVDDVKEQVEDSIEKAKEAPKQREEQVVDAVIEEDEADVELVEELSEQIDEPVNDIDTDTTVHDSDNQPTPVDSDEPLSLPSCSVSIEICNGEDDDCDGLIDEWLDCLSAPVCGDGNVDTWEECDDGNTANGDGCDEFCQEEETGCQVSVEICNGEDDDCDGLIDEWLNCDEAVCGDGNIDAWEECDDGNTANGDGCNATCGVEFCGDGYLDISGIDNIIWNSDDEECDDGNATNGDGCSEFCEVEDTPVCGDGNVDEWEECDDGNTTNGDGCNEYCEIEVVPVCGDGNLDAGEECDDGNNINGDGCSALCAIETPNPYCWDGNVDNWEECDDGNTANGDGCNATCWFEYCGDGYLDPNGPDNIAWTSDDEQCDDGNNINGDGCDSYCAIEVITPVCGNGVVELWEACDDGNTTNGDGCNEYCQIESYHPVCGNGIVEIGEECDDGNTTNGDGCSAYCTLEQNLEYDLSLTKSLLSPTVTFVAGSEVMFTIQVTNEGDIFAQDIQVTDYVPAGLSFVSSTTATQVVGNTIVLDFSDGLQPWASQTETITFLIDPNIQAGTITNWAEIKTDDGNDIDSYPWNGSQWEDDDDSAYILVQNMVHCNWTVWCDGWTMDFPHPLLGDATIYLYDTTTNELVGQWFAPATNNPTTTINGTWITQPTPGATILFEVHYLWGIKEVTSVMPSYCPSCGNGVVDAWEQCDDWNNVNGDGCDAYCALEETTICIDTQLTPTTIELNNGDFVITCEGLNVQEFGVLITVPWATTPTLTMLGGSDTLVYSPTTTGVHTFQCQAWWQNSDPLCPSVQWEVTDEVYPYCGDGNIDAWEECDDGNNINGDGCNATCWFETCGDGYLDTNGPDNIPWNGDDEQCDDGNNINGDGCSAQCAIETPNPYCGDGNIDAWEECDDGNTTNWDGCNATCWFEYCGDGYLDPNGPDNIVWTSDDEQCDDGNYVNGDGCSIQCIIEDELEYDLALVKSLAGQTVTFEVGDEVDFNITVTNEGDVVAQNIVVKDTVPTGLLYNWLPNNFSLNFWPLNPGQSETQTVTMTVAAGASGTITNWAEIIIDDWDDIDSTPANGSQNEDDDDYAYIYVQENELTICTDTELSPTWVELNNGDFEVTCEGDNVEEFGVWITVPGSSTPTLTMLGTSNTLSYTPASTWIYSFQCQARGTQNDPLCPIVQWEVVDWENLSDPVISIEWPATELVCGTTVTYTATIENTNNADVTAEDVLAYIDVPFGHTILANYISVTVANGDTMECEVVGNDQLACTWKLAVWSSAEVQFEVQHPSCSCESSYNFAVEANVTATNGDIDLTNNYDIYTNKAKNTNICGNNDEYDLALVKSLVTSPQVEVGDVVTFAITVQNEWDEDASNITILDTPPVWLVLTWANGIPVSNGTVEYSFNGVTLAPGASATVELSFVVQDSASGTLVNSAEILTDNGNDIDSTPGNGSQNEDDDDTAYVYIIDPTCEDPITNLQVTNYANGSTVNSGSVTIEGVFSGNVLQVELQVNNTTTIANTVNGEFFADINIVSGANTITITALSDDSACTESTTLVLIYKEDQVCEDTIDISIDSPIDDFSTRNSSVLVEWTVDDISAIVTVDGVVVDVDSAGRYSRLVRLGIGDNEIDVVARSSDDCTTTETINVRRRSGGWGRTWGSVPICGNNIINFTEECDDGNRYSGDGCSSTCEIEYEEVEEEIKKKRIITIISRRPEPFTFTPLPQPAILAPTGHEQDERNYVKHVLEAYHSETK